MSEQTDLNAMTRSDLNTYASAHGVTNPESYATKAELITAIEEAETAPTGTDQTSSPEGGGIAPQTAVPGEGEEVTPEIEPSFSEAPDPESRSPNFAVSESTIVSGTQEDQKLAAEPLAPSEAAQAEAGQQGEPPPA